MNEANLPQRAMPAWKLGGCWDCGGDLYLLNGKYHCLQCARPEIKPDPVLIAAIVSIPRRGGYRH